MVASFIPRKVVSLHRILSSQTMFRIAFVCVALIFVAGQSFGQNSPKDDVKIVYDPMFWRDKLHLGTAQCREIEDINRHFYLTLEKTDANDTESYHTFSKLMEERSKRIWNVFSH